MTNYLTTRNEKIYQSYLELKKEGMKLEDIVDTLARRVWITFDTPECLGDFSIRKIISLMKKSALETNSKRFKNNLEV